MFALSPYASAPLPELCPITHLAPSGSSSQGVLALVCGARISPAASALIQAWHSEGRPLRLLLTDEQSPPNLPSGFVPEHLAEFLGWQPPYMPLRALGVHHWLKQAEPAGIVICGEPALAHYTTLARRQGLAHQQAGIWLLDPLPHAQQLQERCVFPTGRTDLERDYLDREAAARCDGLLVSDADLVTWCAGAGWPLPDQVGLLATLPGEPAHVARLVGAPRPVSAAEGRGKRPLVSVCMPTYNRGEMLLETLKAWRRQSYDKIELILVDDGSTDPKTREILDRLEDSFPPGWQLLRQANAGPASARRRAVAAACGEFLLFADDDNLPLLHQVENFVTAAVTSGADILTCIPGYHPESDAAPGTPVSLAGDDPAYPRVQVDWTPLGGSPLLGALINCFGDNNALYRRASYEALGGFQGDRDFVMEDMELFFRAAVQGYRLEVVPEVLFLYRKHKNSRSLNRRVFDSHLQSLFPLSRVLPPVLWPLALMARSGFHARHEAINAEMREKPLYSPGTLIDLAAGSDDRWRVTVDEEGRESSLSFMLAGSWNQSVLFLEVEGGGEGMLSIGEWTRPMEDGGGPNLWQVELPAGLLAGGDVTIRLITPSRHRLLRFWMLVKG